MKPRHPAWTAAEPEWVSLAPGIKWLLRRPDGVDRMIVAADVSKAMGRIYQGRAELEALGLEGEMSGADEVLSLDRLVGYSSLLTANLYAQRCLQDWEGMVSVPEAERLDPTDPDAIRDALVFGPPGTEASLLAPFLAWIDLPKRPMAAESLRLKALAKDHWSGGSDRCRACQDEDETCSKGGSVEGAICPRLENAPQTPEGVAAWEIASSTSGLWAREGMSGSVVGLQYRDALLIFEEQLSRGRHSIDFAAGFAAFRAIEAGRLEAEAERAQQDKSVG